MLDSSSPRMKRTIHLGRKRADDPFRALGGWAGSISPLNLEVSVAERSARIHAVPELKAKVGVGGLLLTGQHRSCPSCGTNICCVPFPWLDTWPRLHS
jgi:hypothetical protein